MSMLTLFMLLLERTALMLLFAYILMNFTFLKATLSQRDQKRSIVILTLVFLIFGIFSNLSGVVVQIPHLTLSSFSLKLPDDAVIANSRVLSISVAGLIEVLGSAELSESQQESFASYKVGSAP